MEEYLAVLGLSPGATQTEIKAAYREMLFLWHPDRFKAGDPLAQKAHQKTQVINEAYEKLKSYRPPASASSPKNPPKTYDRGRASVRSTGTTVAQRTSARPRFRSSWLIFNTLIVVWLMGLISSYTFGGFIHILLLIALVMLIINLIQARRPL